MLVSRFIGNTVTVHLYIFIAYCAQNVGNNDLHLSYISLCMKFQFDTDNKFDLKIMHQCKSFLRNVLMIRCSYCKEFIVIFIIVVHICLVIIKQ